MDAACGRQMPRRQSLSLKQQQQQQQQQQPRQQQSSTKDTLLGFFGVRFRVIAGMSVSDPCHSSS